MTPPPAVSLTSLSSSSSSTIGPKEKQTEEPPRRENSTSPGVCSTSPTGKRQFKHDGVGKKSKKSGETSEVPPTPEIEPKIKTPMNLAPPFRIGNEEVASMSDDLEGMVINENDPLGLEMTKVMAGGWSELSASDLALPLENEAAEMVKEKENN